MKITKRQLRRIIREEKSRLLNEQPIPGVWSDKVDAMPQMSDKVADAAQLLQTVYYNLDDLSAGVEADIATELEMQMELIKDAIHGLGAVLP